MSGYTYGESEPKAVCPYCTYTECYADFVDVGVGYVQSGPYTCDRCNAVEIGSYDDPNRASDVERAIGWYKGEMGREG